MPCATNRPRESTCADDTPVMSLLTLDRNEHHGVSRQRGSFNFYLALNNSGSVREIDSNAGDTLAGCEINPAILYSALVDIREMVRPSTRLR